MINNKGIFFLILCSCALFIAICFGPDQPFAADFESEVDAILSLPEEKIDMGIVALTLAKEIYPDLDIKAYSVKIDEMVEGIRKLTKGSSDPDFRIRAMNTYLYKTIVIRHDLSDPNAEKPENQYLNGILDTRKGSCITMPLLYLSIAQRLGYPVYPVSAPWHFFLRYVDPKLAMQNIEATGGGGYVSDGEYQAVLQVSGESFKSGSYLRTKTYREFIADLVAINAVYWGKRGDYARAVHYLEKSLGINPISADIHKILGTAYLLYSRGLDGDQAEEYRVKGDVFLKKADDLGVTKLTSGTYMEEQKKAQEAYRKKQKKGDNINQVTKVLNRHCRLSAILLRKDSGQAGMTTKKYAHSICRINKDAGNTLYLSFYAARYYDSALARFISPDTEEGPNRYAYVENNPVNMIDPDGRAAMSVQLPGWMGNEMFFGIRYVDILTSFMPGPAEANIPNALARPVAANAASDAARSGIPEIWEKTPWLRAKLDHIDDVKAAWDRWSASKSAGAGQDLVDVVSKEFPLDNVESIKYVEGRGRKGGQLGTMYSEGGSNHIVIGPKGMTSVANVRAVIAEQLQRVEDKVRGLAYISPKLELDAKSSPLALMNKLRAGEAAMERILPGAVRNSGAYDTFFTTAKNYRENLRNFMSHVENLSPSDYLPFLSRYGNSERMTEIRQTLYKLRYSDRGGKGPY